MSSISFNLSTLVKWTCLLNYSIWTTIVGTLHHSVPEKMKRWHLCCVLRTKHTTACGSFSLVKWNKLVMETVCSFPFELWSHSSGKISDFWSENVTHTTNFGAQKWIMSLRIFLLWFIAFREICCISFNEWCSLDAVCGTVNATKASWCSSVSMHFLRIFFPRTIK